jgi:hypothetical protein
MSSLSVLLSIVATLSIGAMSPGPSFVLVSRIAVSRSRVDGLAAAIGMGLGGVLFSMLALAGLTALLSQFGWLPGAEGGGRPLSGLHRLQDLARRQRASRDLRRACWASCRRPQLHDGLSHPDQQSEDDCGLCQHLCGAAAEDHSARAVRGHSDRRVCRRGRMVHNRGACLFGTASAADLSCGEEVDRPGGRHGDGRAWPGARRLRPQRTPR